jgi:hypothetical protein
MQTTQTRTEAEVDRLLRYAGRCRVEADKAKTAAAKTPWLALERRYQRLAEALAELNRA